MQNQMTPFSLSTRLMTGFLLMLLMIILISAISYYTFNKVNENYNEVVVPNVEAVITTINLSKVSASLTDYAPRMVLSRNHKELLTQTLSFIKQHQYFLSLIKNLKNESTEIKYLDFLKESSESIDHYIRDLDILVAQRIEAELNMDRLTLYLTRLIAQYQSEQFIHSLTSGDQNIIQSWLAKIHQVQGLVLSVSSDKDISVTSVRRNAIGKLLVDANQIAASAGINKKIQIDNVQQRIDTQIMGVSGYFSQQERFFQLQQEIKKLVKRERAFSAALSAITLELVESIQSNVRSNKEATQISLSRSLTFITYIVSLAVATTCLVFLFLRRRVVMRFNRLRSMISQYIYHKVPVGSFPGTDELSEIYRALKHLIERVEDREQKLEKLATTDELTEVLNRRGFLVSCRNELKRTKRTRCKASLLMLDIDHFKSVNDTYGHDVGDKALIQVSKLCLTQIREIDTLGRLGGEEFAILLLDAPLKYAKQCAERIRKAIESIPLLINSQTLNLTISIGVIQINLDEESIEDALKRSDELLYNAKKLGRNRFESE